MTKPVWQLFLDATDTPVPWIDHGPNLRFAIYNPGGTNSPNDDLYSTRKPDSSGRAVPRSAHLSTGSMRTRRLVSSDLRRVSAGGCRRSRSSRV